MDLATLDRSIEDVDLMMGVLHRAPPERFRMDAYFQDTGCGTAACIAGWCVLDDAMSERLNLPSRALNKSSGLGVVDRAIPALLDVRGVTVSVMTTWHVSQMHSKWFLYGEGSRHRASEVDDAPFAATPAEIACLGADYARGLNEREAALNRLAIVKACLVKWRAALVPAPVMAEIDYALARASGGGE